MHGIPKCFPGITYMHFIIPGSHFAKLLVLKRSQLGDNLNLLLSIGLDDLSKKDMIFTFVLSLPLDEQWAFYIWHHISRAKKRRSIRRPWRTWLIHTILSQYCFMFLLCLLHCFSRRSRRLLCEGFIYYLFRYLIQLKFSQNLFNIPP